MSRMGLFEGPDSCCRAQNSEPCGFETVQDAFPERPDKLLFNISKHHKIQHWCPQRDSNEPRSGSAAGCKLILSDAGEGA